MNCTVHGILQARKLQWVAFPSPGDFPNPGIEPRSPAWQADSLPAEPQGGRKHTHYTPIRMTKVKKIDNSKVSKGMEALERPCAAGGDETIWKIVWQFLKKLNIHMPHHLFSP